MLKKKRALLKIYKGLKRRFGFLNWWPGENEFEIMVGAILAQNTAWKNVEKAINNLKRKKVLNLKNLAKIEEINLATLIKPSGYFNQKAKKLKNFIRFMFYEFSGDIQGMKSVSAYKMREKLLSVNGIGPETADSILLYALDKKIFVVDAYTRRIFSRIGFVKTSWDYSEIQSFFMSNLPKSLKLYNDFHAQIVILGKEICRKKPLCENCPIQSLCRFGHGSPSTSQN